MATENKSFQTETPVEDSFTNLLISDQENQINQTLLPSTFNVNSRPYTPKSKRQTKKYIEYYEGRIAESIRDLEKLQKRMPDEELRKLVTDRYHQHIKFFECHIAASNGDLERLRELMIGENHLDPALVHAGIRGGHLDIVKFLLLEALPKKQEFNCDQHGYHAAEGGKFHILDWLYDNHCLRLCFLGDLSIRAAKNGRIKVFEWIETKYEADEDSSISIKRNGMVCATATFFGQFETLKWLRKHGYRWDNRTYRAAEFKKYLVIVKWIKKQQPEWLGKPSTIPFDLSAFSSIYIVRPPGKKWWSDDEEW